MGTLFLDTIKQVGIFIICAQAIIHFKHKESYEKYLKVFVSMMVMVQLMTPVFSALKIGESPNFAKQMEEYSKRMEAQIGEIEFVEILAEEKLKELTAAEMNERIRLSQEKEQEEEHGQEIGSESEVIRIERVEVKTGE